MPIRLLYRLSPFIVACCAVAILSGCARMGAMSRVDPVSIAIYPGGGNPADDQAARESEDCPLVSGVNSFGLGAVNLDCFVFPEDRPRLHDAPQATQARAATRGERAYARAVSSDRERNRLTALLLKHSDDICVQEMGRLNSNESAVNTSLSILATAATTTANIVTGDLAQSILTGASTLTGASRSHINAYIYRNTFAYAVSRAITIERRRLRALIEARRGDNTTLFTVDEAIRAVNEYHGVCSFYKGLELVLASVEGDQRSRDAQARQAQINAIEQQIREQTAAMGNVKAEERAAYIARINRLEDQKQALVLAGAELPDAVTTDPTTTTTTPTTPGTTTPTTPGTTTPNDDDQDNNST